jgi:hypothetical protein
MVIGLDGMEKKSRLIIRLPRVKVVNEKPVYPEPRVYMNGGVMKIETSKRTHQTELMARNTRVRNRKARILQRLYGETWNITRHQVTSPIKWSDLS